MESGRPAARPATTTMSALAVQAPAPCDRRSPGEHGGGPHLQHKNPDDYGAPSKGPTIIRVLESANQACAANAGSSCSHAARWFVGAWPSLVTADSKWELCGRQHGNGHPYTSFIASADVGASSTVSSSKPTNRPKSLPIFYRRRPPGFRIFGKSKGSVNLALVTDRFSSLIFVVLTRTPISWKYCASC